MSIVKFYHLGQIDSAILNAICDNDLEYVQRILTTNCYETLDQNEKEKQVFYSIYDNALSGVYDLEPFLKYIIFDYKISEENSINDIPDLANKVKDMFVTRRLNEELSAELVNNNQPNKKPKV